MALVPTISKLREMCYPVPCFKEKKKKKKMVTCRRAVICAHVYFLHVRVHSVVEDDVVEGFRGWGESFSYIMYIAEHRQHHHHLS